MTGFIKSMKNLSHQYLSFQSQIFLINVMTNIYDILMDKADDLSDEETVALLGRKHILYELYGIQLKRDDYNYPELENLVNEEIRIL